MKIKDRLTLQFTGLVALILMLFCCTILYIAAYQRKKDFNNKLKEKALNTVRLLVEVDEIDTDLLKRIRRKYLSSLPDEFVRVYDASNNRIFKDDTISFKMPKEQIDLVRQTSEASFTFHERQIIGIAYDNGKYVVTASAIDKDGIERIWILGIIMFSVYLISLVVIFFSGRLFSKNALKPIARIIDQVRGITVSKLYLRVDEGKNKDEISILANEFNLLFSKVEYAFEMQKRFVSNASHELRTPLTSIIGEVSVILMKERDKKDYQEVLRSILEESQKLRELSNDLLELAQAGIDDELSNTSSINVEDFVKNFIADLAKRENSPIVTLDLNNIYKDKENFITGNESLLLTAFSNVLDNAFKFSGNKPVSIQIYPEGQNVCFKITDEGIGISNKDLSNIFQPFYRTEDSQTIPGYGIGLSLVNRIILLHGGEIKIISEINRGTSFIISLPLSENQSFVNSI
jgi:two-component system, OmpR family, sensor histidine kinase ArlS